MDVIGIARELGKAIQQDDRYEAYMLATKNNDADKTLQDMIEKFNMLRVDINREVSKAEKDQDKLSRLDAEFKDLYKRIMETPNMIAYNAAKGELDALIQFVNQIVLGSANGQDPDSIEQASGCSGSCGSCGGCSN